MRATKTKNTIFIAAPVEARRDIIGGCNCPYCVAHPDRVPQWDTIAVDVTDPKDATFIHHPEFAA